jgi:glycosyltransferase involved in cell wall biosynthesis
VDVSVVVCTWNNCRRLARTLEAIERCAVPPGVAWELVLVDSGCTDDTPAVARAAAARLPLVSVAEPRPGLSRARNAGVRAVSGTLVVFTDDDVTPVPEWLALYWRAFREHPRPAFFGGPVAPDYEAGPPAPHLLPLASLPIAGLDWGPVPRRLAPHERFLGANWACPREALRRAGDFDVRLGLDASLGRRRVGEEWDMMERLRALGLEPWYLPDVAVRHFVPRHKCRLPYLAGNWAAHGHAAALRDVGDTPFLQSRPELRAACRDGAGLGGVPWHVGVRALRAALRAVFARARGERAWAEAYAAWRFHVGVIRGYRERRRQPPGGPTAGTRQAARRERSPG